MSKPIVFISYSHKNESWKNRLVTHLGVLEQGGYLDIWDDRRIGTGEYWEQKIKGTIERASIAILMISADFLTSKFILNEEVPRILERREMEGLRIFPIIIKPCAWQHIKWLARMQARPKDGQALSTISRYRVDKHLTEIANEIYLLVKKSGISIETPDFVLLGPERISLAKLPSTTPELFGREKELALLHSIWANRKRNILTIVAWGGVGKTTLVNKWLIEMCENNYGGAELVYGYSFYSQGATEGRQVSSDLFIANALEWFGDPDPTKGSHWDRGQRLAELIRQKRTLLIIDGLEPLQYPPGEMEGRLKDTALRALFRELAVNNPGLCIITTRMPVDDLKNFEGAQVESVHLEHLSPEAGAEYLRYLGVIGTFEELKQAVQEYDGHSLALTLLGRYIVTVFSGDIRQRGMIARLTKEKRQGGHAKRVMESYEKWFTDKPELDILYILGIFDRPVEGGAIEIIKAPPCIEGLTSRLHQLPNDEWEWALNNLRAARLIANKDPQNPSLLDCHPLVREHYGDKVKVLNPQAWTEAHRRLYEYYKSQTKEYPETIEEMTPLYSAVAHACQAGLHQNAFDEVYKRRIQRYEEYYNMYKLGAFSADLAILSGFFEEPWYKPVRGLSALDRNELLGCAGFVLSKLGRFTEAMKSIEAALQEFLRLEDWKEAAINANNLSELHLTTGDLITSCYYAEKCLSLADLSGEVFWKVNARTVLATVLHQKGKFERAEYLFRKAEEMQKIMQPGYPYLKSIGAVRYCELLLDKGKYLEVRERAERSLGSYGSTQSLFSVAADHLYLGRSYLLEAVIDKNQDLKKAARYLENAVLSFRRSGQLDYLPPALLARAELFRLNADFIKARADIDEAMAIATRSAMQLHQADCQLEYARFYSAVGDASNARNSLAVANMMIHQMGYLRREKDLILLKEQLQ